MFVKSLKGILDRCWELCFGYKRLGQEMACCIFVLQQFVQIKTDLKNWFLILLGKCEVFMLLICKHEYCVNVLSTISFFRSLDICLDNEVERIHAQKLTRKLASSVPNRVPRTLIHPLVAIGSDGAGERDRMVRASLACLCELSRLHINVLCDFVPFSHQTLQKSNQ